MENDANLVVKTYAEFRKVVCECIKEQNTYLKSQEEVENFIETGGGEGIIEAMYNENKHFFEKGLYVQSKASAAAFNVG